MDRGTPRFDRILVPLAIDARMTAGGVVHALGGRCMGTTWSVRCVGPAELDVTPIEQAVRHELDQVVAQMSSWEPDADLARFNRAAAGTWQTLPPAFFEVLVYALTVARDSGGAYDPTAGALVNAWGFGPFARYDEATFAPPSEDVLRAARACSGWAKLPCDPSARRVRQPGGLQLDLSAVAKGYAVDRVAELLQGRFGIDSSLVEIGGELRGRGTKPDGAPWWVALETPEGAAPDLLRTVVALHGLAVATSGDYVRYFEHGGARHSHTIDPRRGVPITHALASVTVLHRRCMAADALSTALAVRGAVEGAAWAERRGIAALFVTREAGGRCREHMTNAFAALAQ